MNNELYHWKYVKREKVGGKWVYTYDNGSAAKKNYQQAQNNLNTRNAQERSAYQRNLPSDGVKNVAIGNHVKYDHRDPYYGKGPKTKLEKKANDSWNNYKGSPEQRKEARQELVKRTVNSAKNWAKDKLGYDEKHAMNVANTKAMIKDREAADEYVRNSIWKGKNPGNVRIAEMADWATNYNNELAKEARAEADKAAKEFAKTPLGMLERANDFVDSSEESLEYGRASVRRDDAYQRYRDATGAYANVKWKVDTGEYFDKDRGNFSILEPYEKEYHKTRQEYLSAEREYEKAKKEYESTPQYALKRASDRIKSGRKKASEFFKTHRI